MAELKEKFTPHKYGSFSGNQIRYTKKSIRKRIFFLLLCVDPDTKSDYGYVNVDSAFNGLLLNLGGLNSVLFYPTALVDVISLLEEARILYNSDDFVYWKYKKCVLEAGKRVLDIDNLPSGYEDEDCDAEV